MIFSTTIDYALVYILVRPTVFIKLFAFFTVHFEHRHRHCDV